MNLKAKIAMGMASATLGATAIMGGTFAYFSSSTQSDNAFRTGTVTIAPSQTYLEHFNIVNFKPGDLLDASIANQEPAMTLNNQGSLPFHVIMNASLDSGADSNLASTLTFRQLAFGSTNLIPMVNQALNTINHLSQGQTGFRADDHAVTLADLVNATSHTTYTANSNPGDSASLTSTWTGLNIGDLFPGKAPDQTDLGNDAQNNIKSLTYQIAFPDSGQDQNSLQNKTAPFLVHFDAVQFDGTKYSNAASTPATSTTPQNIHIDNNIQPSGGGLFTQESNY